MTWGLRRWRTPPPNRRADGAAEAGRGDWGGTDWGGADWVDVGALGDLRDNRLVVEVDGASVVVVRAGRLIVAVENECPHLGSRLSDGDVSGRVIRCAAHGYRWDLTTGKSLQGPRGPRRRPLRQVPVRLARRPDHARPAGHVARGIVSVIVSGSAALLSAGQLLFPRLVIDSAIFCCLHHGCESVSNCYILFQGWEWQVLKEGHVSHQRNGGLAGRVGAHRRDRRGEPRRGARRVRAGGFGLGDHRQPEPAARPAGRRDVRPRVERAEPGHHGQPRRPPTRP